MSKIFTYEQDGLSYTVTVYQDENGDIKADIVVDSGYMDVNAIYLGDDDFSGKSESLDGPLNMNGGGTTYEGEKVQWDEAQQLSDPGLGTEGEDKDTFLAEGDSMTVTLNVDSLDDVDFFGIRATSTSTPEGSIKAVSGDPEDEPEDDPLTFDKVFFTDVDHGTSIEGELFIWDDIPPEDLESAGLAPDAEGTFENYVQVFDTVGYFGIEEVDDVRFYDTSGEYPVEIEEMRITAPEGGFTDAASMIDAYDDMMAEMEASSTEGEPAFSSEDLVMSLFTGEEPVEEPAEAPVLEIDAPEEEPAIL